MRKSKLTASLIEKLNEDPRPTLEQALQEWWKNPKDQSGLRLTLEGRRVFDSLDLECFEFPVPPSTPARPGQLLTLDRKLTCPYYISLGKAPSIVLYGSREATMLAMYGDSEKWLRYLNRQ